MTSMATLQFDELRDLLETQLAPMFPGATIDGAPVGLGTGNKFVAAESPVSLLLQLPGHSSARCRFRRSQPFDDMERTVIEHFMTALGQVGDLRDRPCFPTLLRRCADEVVARSVKHHAVDDSLVPFILDTMQDWASQTYEGGRIAAAIGIDPHPNAADISNVHVREFITADFARVLTNGLDALLVLSPSGHVVRHESLGSPNPDSTAGWTSFAPLRTQALAKWASQGRVALALNRLGEILVFHKQRLRFARRRGTWFHLPHESVIKRMGHIGTPKLRRAIYETCLDVSFARHGGCIALVKRTGNAVFQKRVKEQDRLASADTSKAALLRHCIGLQFENMPRLMRLAIASVDGAVVIHQDGRVLAAGSIVQIDGGSTGGGRRAAAIALSRAGRAIKVSADGGIVCFTDRGPKESPEIAYEMCT